MGKLLLLFFILIACFHFSNTEVFTSVTDIKHMLIAVDGYQAAVEAYMQQEDQRLEKLRQHLEELKDVGKILQEKREYGTDKAVWHPTDLYKFVSSWAFVSEYLSTNTSVRAYQNMLKRQNIQVPEVSKEDHTGAIQALLRLQKVYNISTESMAEGLVLGVKGMALDPDDCVKIGLAATHPNEQGLRAQWLEQAFMYGPYSLPNPGPIAYQLAITSTKIGDYEKAAQFMDIAVEANPTNKDFMSYRSRSKQNNHTLYRTSNGIPKQTAKTFIRQAAKADYEALCRGDKLPFHDPTQVKFLHCRVHYVTGPYEYYNVEYLSLDPLIAVYHNVTNKKEANFFINKGAPHLKRASIVKSKDNTGKAEIRISKVAWLPDDTKEALKLTKRMERITGLSTHFHQRFSASEHYQLVNYGIGGQYEPHLDALGDENIASMSPIYAKKSGDRIATFLLYLTDITAGGATVFSEAKVTVPPIQYSGALWFNLHPDGSTDTRTKHAGCPVLLGEKWVINKWIRYREQFKKRPCGLHSNSMDPYYENFLRRIKHPKFM